jgi:hypothetical protein
MPISQSRVVFIVGFERCMTTSLARYLVDNEHCSLLVDGIKEPSVFASQPELATAIVARETSRRQGQWLLDASVDYVVNPKAMRHAADTVEDYRVIICLRNQLARTLSAFAFFKAVHTRPSNPSTLYAPPGTLKFGDEALRSRAAQDPLAPAFFRRQPPGRYIFTAVSGSVRGLHDGDPLIEAMDAEVEVFAKATLPARIVEEHKHQRRTGDFPLISILLYSYFTYGLQLALSLFDPGRMLLLTLDDARTEERIGATLCKFLGIERDWAEVALSRTNSSESLGGVVDAHEKEVAARLLDQSFRRDTAQVIRLIESVPQLDLALFSPEALYH